MTARRLRTMLGLCLLYLMAGVSPGTADGQGQPFLVGVYANPPLVSMDAKGIPHGLAIDLLEVIARSEGWQLQYVTASWPELMELLQSERIDLLTAIAYTPERAETLRFTREPILTNWGVVYRHQNTPISTVLDLSGRRIGMLDRDTHARSMVSMLSQFGIEAEIVYGTDYRELLSLLAHGELDAAVVNRLVGHQHAHPDLVATHIIFNPVEIHYASGREEMIPVLRAIDTRLSALKSQGASVYHEALRRWIDRSREPPQPLPSWLGWVLGGTLALLVLLAILSVLLRHQVQRRTRDLYSQSLALEAEIQERRQAQERLNELAYSDSLTRLPNRALFQDRLRQAMEYAKRHDRLIALLFIDLDDFKRVNDSLGHAVGDRLLQDIARRFKRQLSETDTLARLGGDEFTVILSDIQRPQDAVSLVRKLLGSLKQPFELGEHRIQMTASIGITLYPTDDTQETDLLKDADTAMYQAKARGKNTFDFYAPELTRSVRARLAMENELRVALANGQLTLHYQPLVKMANGVVQTFEALVRWNKPDQGFVPPDEFIPVAEESGLIMEMGDWVIEQVCAQLHEWDREGLASLSIAMNFSPVQFQRDGLVSRLAGSMRRHHLASHRIHVEITESLLMERNRHVAETLRTLDAMGIVLSIDDFGTGYSSLSYLRHFPIHVLKVDRSFVHDMLQGPDSRALVEAIVVMAHALRMEVVAEGVETNDQMAALRAMGCDQVQGFLMARPMPADQVADWMAQHAFTSGVNQRVAGNE